MRSKLRFRRFKTSKKAPEWGLFSFHRNLFRQTALLLTYSLDVENYAIGRAVPVRLVWRKILSMRGKYTDERWKNGRPQQGKAAQSLLVTYNVPQPRCIICPHRGHTSLKKAPEWGLFSYRYGVFQSNQPSFSSNSAMRTAPPAAPRSVLCERPTNFQSNSVSSRSRPTDTPMPP